MIDNLRMTTLEALRPRRAYLVCATPRSGSTLLCEMLVNSGVAGRPAEHIETLRPLGRPREPREYFAGLEDRDVLELLPRSAPAVPHSAPLEARLAAVLRDSTTPNGVFGTKVMWGYLADLQECLDSLAPGWLPRDVRHIHVSRHDHVAQAVSMWRALQTRAWRAENDDAVEPVYSFAGIDHLVRMLDAHDDAWCAWFAEHGITPLRLSYDELAADPPGQLHRTLAFLGVDGDLDAEPAAEPPLRRQAGAQSAEWADRYRRER
jgi:LPS sulfotransferase NodH